MLRFNPRFPVGLGETNGQFGPESHKRLAQHHGFVTEAGDPPFVVIPDSRQPKVPVSSGGLVDQCGHAMLLDESHEFTAAGRPLLEIDKVGLHAAFTEEPKRLSSILVFLCSEYLYFQIVPAAVTGPTAIYMGGIIL